MFSKKGYIIPEKKLQQYKSTPAKEWQGLSDDKIDKIWYKSVGRGIGGKDWVLLFARAIEQALRCKNGN